MAGKLSREGFALFVSFVQALRECLNSRGWLIEGEVENQGHGEVFCEVRNAQNLPEVSNFFITEFIEEHENHYDRRKFIGLMLHFNAWLFAHRYSNLKLSLLANQ